MTVRSDVEPVVTLTLTFDLIVRSERLAAAAAILRMSGLLLDFMISKKTSRLFQYFFVINIFIQNVIVM